MPNSLICSCVPTASMFSLKNPEVETTAGGENEKEEHDFQTDEDEGMEVDTQVVQKRKKVCEYISWHFVSVSQASLLRTFS